MIQGKKYEQFILHMRVRLKKENITGIIVDISEPDTKSISKQKNMLFSPIYFIEVDDEYKTGDISKDLLWKESDEIEKYNYRKDLTK